MYQYGKIPEINNLNYYQDTKHNNCLDYFISMNIGTVSRRSPST